MLSKFPNKTLKVGAKVSLSPESRWIYHNPNNNPVGVPGVVRNETPSYVYVVWETRLRSTAMDYRKEDYDLIAEGEPGYLEV